MRTEVALGLAEAARPLGAQAAADGGVRAATRGARPHVFVVVPRGEVIRNFVYTGALDRVAGEASVSLLSVIPNGEIEGLLRSRYRDIFHLREHAERRIVRLQRELLDTAHGRWLWSEAAQERWRLRDAEARTAAGRLKRWGKKLACYPFANRRGLELLSKVERASSRWFRTTDEYVRLLREVRPSLVFNGSHVHSQIATQAVQAAQWLGIPTATFIFSWDNLTSQGRILLPYDYFIVWNETLRDQLLDLYGWIRPEQVFVTGTPQFDFHFREEFRWTREEFCARVGADPSRPVVLYSTGMANHMPGEPQIVEGIADMLKGMDDLGSPQLLVRVYPKDLTGRFEELARRRPDILFPRVPWDAAWLTPRYEDSYVLTNTLLHAAAGVNVASTVSLELCMFDKPVINVGYNPPGMSPAELDYARYYKFDHYRPVVESKAVRVAWSPEEMRAMLRRALTAPQEGREERRRLTRTMFGDTLDGRSCERVADLLVKLAMIAPGAAVDTEGRRASPTPRRHTRSRSTLKTKVVSQNAMKLIDEMTYKLWQGPLRRPFRAVMRRVIDGRPEIFLGPMRGKRFTGGTLHHRVGVYELHIQYAMEAALAEGDVFYDIGANYGFLTLLGSKQVGPSGMVYAFEPLPENIGQIEKVMSENSAKNYAVVPMAVSNVCGSVNFYFSEGGSRATPSLEHGSRGQALEVGVTTLDAFAAEHRRPSLIKMDIEGAEVLALEGAKAIMNSAPAPSWIIEIHDEDKDREVSAVLAAHGYRVSPLRSPHEGGKPYPRQIFASKR